ncbi:hypothetical protein M407DRAFT_152417 [Tulasnella calospora MUT 4182]|uniref:Uncharacterized protein n=1 Tax=Tulasnella calospora MUT 4182 TaxID=1051891 RepID=A0A0C3Q5X5_9AGAM|nr:hypothetical protein M407DRAFT_152417 [Tulasnella calospora MUT 4182]
MTETEEQAMRVILLEVGSHLRLLFRLIFHCRCPLQKRTHRRKNSETASPLETDGPCKRGKKCQETEEEKKRKRKRLPEKKKKKKKGPQD